MKSGMWQTIPNPNKAWLDDTFYRVEDDDGGVYGFKVSEIEFYYMNLGDPGE